MWRFLFFFMGVPMMIMSFFETVDVLPYVQSVDLMVDGKEIVLTEEESAKLQEEVFALFENSRTMPAFGVCFDEMHKEEVKNGTFVSLKFDGIYQVNDLPFDELVFKVERDFQGFNLCRGMRGIFQGRCIYIDLVQKDMSALSSFIESLPTVQEAKIPQSENNGSEQIPQENEQTPLDAQQDGAVEVPEMKKMENINSGEIEE